MTLFERYCESYKRDETIQPRQVSPIATDVKPPSSVASIPSESVIVKVPEPSRLEFKYKDNTIYSQIYNVASYYFYHCLPVSTICKRMPEETLRRGLEWKPRFQSKCPRCGQEYQRNVTTCTVCDYEGTFLKPNLAQQQLLVNSEGTSLLTKCNKYGWTLEQLCSSYLVLTLVYNQPIVLSRSLYIADKVGNIKAEVPGDFIPIAPSSAKMIFDENGEPGDGTGFTIFDRSKVVSMTDHLGFNSDMKRLYPARWCIGDEDTGQGLGTYYSNKEVFHKTYGITSVNYGMPMLMLASTEIRALIAIASRTEKYYTTGHPLGILFIAGIDSINMSAVKRDIQDIMQNDPYGTPIIGIPPVREDSSSAAKWIPLADNPTNELVAVKRELLERVCALFGVPSFVMGDLSAHKGVSNEEYQITMLDRALLGLRRHVNDMLDWILTKYPMITDWVLHVVEPPDKQAADEATAFSREIENAKGLKELGFKAISQSNGHIEMSGTPDEDDPFTVLSEKVLNPDKDKSTEGNNLPAKTNEPKDPLEAMTKSYTSGGLSSTEMLSLLNWAYQMGVKSR